MSVWTCGLRVILSSSMSVLRRWIFGFWGRILGSLDRTLEGLNILDFWKNMKMFYVNGNVLRMFYGFSSS